MILRKLLVDGLLAFLISSGKTPLMEYMHRDWLAAHCCLSLHRLHRYKESSLRTCYEHPQQCRFLTDGGNLPKAPLICYQKPLRVSPTNYLYFPVIKNTIGSAIFPPSKVYDTVLLTIFENFFLGFFNCLCISRRRYF